MSDSAKMEGGLSRDHGDQSLSDFQRVSNLVDYFTNNPGNIDSIPAWAFRLIRENPSILEGVEISHRLKYILTGVSDKEP